MLIKGVSKNDCVFKTTSFANRKALVFLKTLTWKQSTPSSQGREYCSWNTVLRHPNSVSVFASPLGTARKLSVHKMF